VADSDPDRKDGAAMPWRMRWPAEAKTASASNAEKTSAQYMSIWYKRDTT
jgi:hypothetical protein